MKLFKITDVTISLAMLILFSAAYAWNDSFDGLITSYFVTGGWQTISMAIHAFHNWHTRKWGARYIYHRITFISLATIPLGSFWLLGFAAPFMAAFYTGLCMVEVFHREKRPSELLGK